MRLTDCFSELIAYTSHIVNNAEKQQLTFDDVKTNIHRLLSDSQEWLKKNMAGQEDYDQARFAICAWIDEAILSSNWQGKTLWQKEQLQRLYYNTTEAGEEFFDRLNALGLQQRDAREVYYLCLAMGFQGRYCKEGDDYLLEQLKSSNLKLLLGSSLGLPSVEKTELFPDAYPAETDFSVERKTRWEFSPFTLVFMGGPLALFISLLLIYTFILSSIGDNLLNTIL